MMAAIDETLALMTELGPSADDIAAVLQTADAEWAVAYDPQTAVAIDVDEAGVLGLSIELGKPAADRQLEVYAALLAYNTLQRETGGVTMAVAGMDGPVLQTLNLPLHGLTVGEFRTVLANFVGKARIWRVLVSETAESPVAAGMPV
jgi:hypothetical protein